MPEIHFDLLTLLGVALAGYLLGSFNTVLCYRIPRDIPLGLFSNQRSRCGSCEKIIPWHNNIPIFSYLFLNGKCSQCGAKIPLRYFLIELTTFLSFIVTYLIYANSPHKPTAVAEEWAELAKLLLFTLALVSTIFIDIEFRIIPDRYSLGCWALALGASALWGVPDLWSSILGSVMGFGLFFLMAWGYEKLKGIEGLGFGDVKMMGWLGAWVGVMGVPFTILVASLTGLVAGLIDMKRSKTGLQTAIPFGPFLAFGGYLAWALGALGLF